MKTGLPVDQWTEYGRLLEPDLSLLNLIREEYAKKDPDWGDLKPNHDAKHNYVWIHPKSGELQS